MKSKADVYQPKANASSQIELSSMAPSLDTFKHSWEPGMRPVEVFWETQLRSNRHALWPFLANTSDFNARLGLPEAVFQEKDGQLFGVSGKGVFKQEWVEVPWEWEMGKWLTAERRYSKGFARAMRAHYRLSDHEDGTKLTVYLGWVPRFAWTRPLINYLNGWILKRYAGVLREVDELAKSSSTHPMVHPNPAVPKVDESRLQTGFQELIDQGISVSNAERLGNYIRTASDQSLFRIRPKLLALEWGVELEELLSLLLQATHAGWLQLSWDVMCPHCQGVRRECRSLGELREYGRCDICAIDFNATTQESIEVTFRVLPEIRVVRPVYYCSAEPAKKPHIILQQALAVNEVYNMDQLLSPGRYRLRRATGEQAARALEVVEKDGESLVTWNVDEEHRGSLVLIRPDVHFVLRNPTPEPAMVVLEKVANDPFALRPKELFNLHRFRDLFSEESIASGLKLEVGHQTILFTDIVGSTRLYATLGDAKAFNAVRDHFVRLQNIIATHRGAVVKTIGDAMMAGFLHPKDALRAAVEIQKTFPLHGKGPVTIRASIHRGIALAVCLDANIDYFGNAVNYAAKIQALAGPGEIAFSKTFSSLPGILERCKKLRLNLVERKFVFPSGPSEESNTVFVASSPKLSC